MRSNISTPFGIHSMQPTQFAKLWMDSPLSGAREAKHGSAPAGKPYNTLLYHNDAHLNSVLHELPALVHRKCLSKAQG